MPDTNPSIYRENALEEYKRGREKEVLPHLVVPPAFVALWLVLGLLLLGGILAWLLGLLPMIGSSIGG